MPSQDWPAFVEDIRENGVMEPAVLYEGMILDGSKRYRACQEIGIDIPTVDFDGTREEAYQFVISHNDARTHLTKSERTYSIVKMRKWLDDKPEGGEPEPAYRDARRRAPAADDTPEQPAPPPAQEPLPPDDDPVRGDGGPMKPPDDQPDDTAKRQAGELQETDTHQADTPPEESEPQTPSKAEFDKQVARDAGVSERTAQRQRIRVEEEAGERPAPQPRRRQSTAAPRQSMKEKLDEAEGTVHSLRQDVYRLETDVERLQEQIKLLEAGPHNEEALQQLRLLQGQNDALRSQMGEWQYKHDREVTAHRETRSRLKAAQDELNTLRGE